MSVSRAQIEAELGAAQRALDAAMEQRREAERVLWESVARRVADPMPPEQIEAARMAMLDAERRRSEAEVFVRELRRRFAEAQHRESRLLAITDTLIARDEARRAAEAFEFSRAVALDAAPPPRHRLWRRLLHRGGSQRPA